MKAMKQLAGTAYTTLCTAMIAFAGNAEAARGLMPTNAGNGAQVSTIATNLGRNADSTGDAAASGLYAIGSLALLYAGYVAWMYSKHKGKDQGGNTLGKAAMAVLAGGICLYMPTALNLGVTTGLTGGGTIQGVK